MKRFLKKLIPYAIGVALLGAIVWSFLPRPFPVDVAVAKKGSLRVVVEEDGKTRIRERYLLSAPVAGHLQRIELKAGNGVHAGKTVVAWIEPADPALLDDRAKAEAEAKVRSAQSNEKMAQAKLDLAKVHFELAKTNHDRARELKEANSISKQEYDDAEHKERMSFHEWKAAQSTLQVAISDLQWAQAALVHTQSRVPGKPYNGGKFEMRAPVTGKVLRVFQESAAVVTPGAKLLEIGDPLDLEIEIDVLSRDAVSIRSGNTVFFEHWGGEAPLLGRVRHVEPAAFLKISALGVEEQRVWVIADFVDPPEKRGALGDAFRVEARIVTWEGADILQVPAGALFRKKEQWSVFVVADGRAQLRAVEVGRSNGLDTEIRSGLSAGDQIVVHPGDRIQDGVQVQPR
ncbi:MAG: efflux RND transporter periplasmic adaptor subunit [Gemmataceae bacterium]|nr:efflux RND transporter periplasmic adaptor subunit [Gemmataceae bacterium]MCI0738656.1 efflux RND transporter periplasmic adaptor subunit [Gemmataceae bacterium]